MIKKRVIFFLICLSFLIISTGYTEAIGLKHGNIRTPIIFEPGKIITFSFEVVGYTADADISAEGELAEYVKFDIKKEGKITAVATITLPNELEPGLRSLFIRVDDVLPGKTMMGGKTAMRKSLPVLVLSPEKIILADIIPTNLNEGETADFSVKVESRTTQRIFLMWAVMDIYDHKGLFIKRIKTGSSGIKSNDKQILSARFDSKGLEAGDYSVNGTVFFDGKEYPLKRRQFKIGKLNIRIHKLPDSLEINKINKFDIWLLNEWNDELKNVYADVILEKEKTSTSVNALPPLGMSKLEGFINTEGLETGRKYLLKIDVHYNDLVFSGEKNITIVNPPKEVEEKPSFIEEIINNPVYLFGTGIVLAMVVMNIVFMMLMKKRVSEEKAKEEQDSKKNRGDVPVPEKKKRR